MSKYSRLPIINFSINFNKKEMVIVMVLLFTASLSSVLLLGFLPNYYSQKFAPQTYIQEIDVSGMAFSEAEAAVSDTLPPTPSRTITVSAGNTLISSSSAQLKLSHQTKATLIQAWKFGKSGTRWKKAKELVNAFRNPRYFQVGFTFRDENVKRMVSELKQQADEPGHRPQAILGTSGSATSLSVDAGKIGYLVKEEPTIELIQSIAGSNIASVSAVIQQQHSTLTEEEQLAAVERAKMFIGLTIVGKTKNEQITIQDTDMISALSFPSGFNQESIDELVARIEDNINRDSQNAEFVFNPETLEVTTFVPDEPGLKVLSAKTRTLLLETLEEIDTPIIASSLENADAELVLTEGEDEIYEIEIPVKITQPNKTLADTNNLGIIEVIGHGESEYAHSIPNRIHNVAHTSELISNTIIPPGEEYSFVKSLGEVSQKTGFKSAYIIRNGRTELGDGGGVCQVSTTLFRAILDGGLLVTKRIPHSYRVSYYELDTKPGVDATVYTGEVDLRFKNDTDHYILISAEADSENLEMSVTLYGTSDGRYTELVDHITKDYRSPLPPEYYPDPSLAPGELRQIDQAQPGITATFSNIIYDAEGNQIRKDDYVSRYRPWAAKYLQGI